MTIEELNLDVRMYNQVKRERINDVDTLLERLYAPDRVRAFPPQTQRNIERALKTRGVLKFTQGEYVTADDIMPEPLTWEQLHALRGKLIARDISTQSQKAYRVCWVFDFSNDDKTIMFQYSNDYAHSGNDGRFYALQDFPYGSALSSPAQPAETAPEPEKAEIIVPEAAPLSDAVALHRRIMADISVMAQSLAQMCKDLKQMRDSQLYREMGYDSFEAYTENEVGIKRRQAYTYIQIAEKLPEDFVQSTAQLGVQKLALLATVTDDQREQLTESTDLESVTVRELKAQIETLRASAKKESEQNLREQEAQQEKISDLTRRLQERVEQVNSLSEQNADLEEQVRELESRPIEVAVQTIQPNTDNTVQHNTAQHSTVRHNTIQPSTDQSKQVQSAVFNAKFNLLKTVFDETYAAMQEAGYVEKEVLRAWFVSKLDKVSK